MAPSDAFSGQIPLMKVNQQQPQHNHAPRTDQDKFRLSVHTFVSDKSLSLSSTTTSGNGILIAQKDKSRNARPAYKRIAFTKANIPGQPISKDVHGSTHQSRRKRRRTTQASENPRLRTFKPLSSSADMHADAWSIILAHTKPSFVMQMRTVSKFFYHITNAESIWRDAREYHFGHDMPSRPPFLTERQYASLLDGRGCQNPQCERRETRKVRWVFRLRLCDECLLRKVELHVNDGEPSPQSRYASLFDNTPDRDQYGTSIVDLLPTSGTWSGKPNSPRGVSEDKWSPRLAHSAPLSYLKTDYAALKEEYKTIQEEDWDPQRVFDWVQEKYRYAIMVATAALELESWESRRFQEILLGGTHQSIRDQRRDFFAHKALHLVPPMSEEVLRCFAAYQTSLASSNSPTDRSWDTLWSKIRPHRSLAEEVVKFASSRRYSTFGRSSTLSTTPESLWSDQLNEHRRIKRKETGTWQPEQRFVLDLALEEYNKLINVAADEDLVLLCLHNVYRAYQDSPDKPQGLNLDGKVGEYRLSLDDAKLVVEEIIEKQFKKTTLRGVKILEGLRCMGCTRFNSGKRYSFQSAFEHMLDKHSRLVGKNLHFHRFLKNTRMSSDCLTKDFRFPWYLVEWTRSLPLLPSHAEVTAETRWIPDEDVTYVEMSKPETRSVFEGRHAVPQKEGSTESFSDNFVHAVKTLSSTRLDTESVVKIAIRYGTDLSVDGQPTLEEFLASIKPTQELGSGLLFKFRCGACNRRPEVNSHLRCVKHTVDFSMLRKHWDDKHSQETIDWTTDFMDLPSDTTLLQTMLTQDEKLRKDRAKSIARETIGLKKNAKKMPDHKAGALMQKEMAMEAFGRLFAISNN